MQPYCNSSISKYDLSKPHHYVYALLDPRRPGRFFYEGFDATFLYEPFYIGKGSGVRIYSHITEAKKSKSNLFKNRIINKIAKKCKRKPIALVLEKDLTDSDALLKEISLINAIGRRNKKKGPLTNLTDGGEGSSGWKHSARSKELISASNRRREVTDKTKRKISISVRKKKFKHSPETRLKMSQRTSGKNNYFFGKRFCGSLNPNYGKTIPEHQKKILREVGKKRTGDKNPNSRYLYCLKKHNKEFHNACGLYDATGDARFKKRGFPKGVDSVTIYGWTIHRILKKDERSKKGLCPCSLLIKK